jgi:hypothetical protein
MTEQEKQAEGVEKALENMEKIEEFVKEAIAESEAENAQNSGTGLQGEAR